MLARGDDPVCPVKWPTCNGNRRRLWKVELARLATELGIEITVIHLPPGASKWNKIEHRLFSAISMNWRGRPLESHQVILETIRATTTRTGLKVQAELDTGSYPTGIEVTSKQMKDLEAQVIIPHEFHPDWNYTIVPGYLGLDHDTPGITQLILRRDLSGLLFGSSSEKGGSLSRGNGRAGGDRPGGAGKRGQRPGRPGHGRRDRSHLETEERVLDVDAGQRCCAECGRPFEFLGTEDSKQVDRRVKITRIVWRRRRYRRRCSHRGPATVCAPPAARPAPKGLFTAGFLARLAYEKHVLGRPVHRIVAALAADGFDVAPGTLCGALKQVAPLIAPWADKTTVFVMDASRSAEVAAGQLGIDREQSQLEAGRRLVISADFHKAYQSLARIDRADPLWCWPISGGISRGPGLLTPRRSATGATRGPSGSRCCTGRTTRSRPPHRAPTPMSASRAAGSGRSPTSMRIAYCRPPTRQRACCTPPPPRSSPR